jgi:hypothetical protein
MANGSKAQENICTEWIFHFPLCSRFSFLLDITLHLHCCHYNTTAKNKYFAHNMATQLPLTVLSTRWTAFPTCTDRSLPYRHSCDVLINSSTDTLSVRYCGVSRGMRTVASSLGRSFLRTSGSLFTHRMTASNTSNRLKNEQ